MAEDKLSRRLAKIVKVLVEKGLLLEQARREFEKQFILEALRSHDGNLGQSAKALGIHRNTLRNKISTLGIEMDSVRDAGNRQPLRRSSR